MSIPRGLSMFSLEEVAERIESREVSPVEVTEQILQRIERLDPNLNAFLTVTADAARAAARTAEAEISAGEYRGPLHGIPVAHKDLFDTAGVRTTAGSKIMAERVPTRDARVVEMMSAAGAVAVGKLGLHEFAFGGTSDNPHHGTIRNPWGNDRCPAGSSGGSGSAVAAGLTYAATGSDTGGSIRMPASFCGTVGLMPTYGRVSLDGAIPLSWTLDHAGPLTRTVRDAALMLQVISGYDPRDPTSERHEVPDYLEGIEDGPRGLRIGVPQQYFWEATDEPVRDAVRAAIAALEQAGSTIVEVNFEKVQTYVAAAATIIVAEAAAYHTPWFPSRREEYGADVASLLQVGQSVPAPVYANAMRTLAIARAGEADAVLHDARVDVLAVPTTPLTAPTIEEARNPEVAGRHHVLTMPFDLTGQPVIALPCGLVEGLPTSVSFVGRRWDERVLLRAGRAYELVRGPFPSPPIALQG